MRILCLDIGTKRIGVAVSDPMGWTAQPLGVIRRKTKMRDFDEIFEYINQTGAEKLVIGVPLATDGGIGKAAKAVLDLVEEIRVFLKEKDREVPIETWDESYSTVEAETHLIGANLGRKKRRKVIDKMAAQRILTDYLESKK